MSPALSRSSSHLSPSPPFPSIPSRGDQENFQKIITRNVSSRSPPLVRQEMMHAQEQEVETDDDELDAPLPRLRSPSEEDLINEDFQMEEELIPLRVDTEIEINVSLIYFEEKEKKERKTNLFH